MTRSRLRLAALPLLFALSTGVLAVDARSDPAPDAELAAAEAAIEQARQHQALWTTAVAALREARAALARGDNAAVETWSRQAQELAELGLRQRRAQDTRADQQ
jgi:hypothetical protein